MVEEGVEASSMPRTGGANAAGGIAEFQGHAVRIAVPGRRGADVVGLLWTFDPETGALIVLSPVGDAEGVDAIVLPDGGAARVEALAGDEAARVEAAVAAAGAASSSAEGSAGGAAGSAGGARGAVSSSRTGGGAGAGGVEATERKKRVVALLEKNRLPVREVEEGKLEVLGGVLSIAAPYTDKSCFSTNSTVLTRVAALLSAAN